MKDPNSPPGRLETALNQMFMTSAKVVECRTIADRFRVVAFGGDALTGTSWTPGQKVQVALGGWRYRTYTPMAWDAAAGVMQLLIHLHGQGPGTAWARSLKPGTHCAMFGPRSSLELGALRGPALLFGDETSFGLAHAMRFTPRARRSRRR